MQSFTTPLPMEDGVRLATDIFLPSGSGGPYPALVMRTPYDKARVEDGRMIYTKIVAEAVKAGYAVAIQDLRGRFQSEGDFVPFHENPESDARDGAADLVLDQNSRMVRRFGCDVG